MNTDTPDIAVIAPGLLGASLAAASKSTAACGTVHVWARRPEVRDACRSMEWCDEIHDEISSAVARADIVWICAPVSVVPKLAAAMAGHLKPGAVVSDVGSTKGKLVSQCERALGKHAAFVGSHPIAGSEKSGMEHADSGLYKGRPCFITPTEASDEGAVERIIRYWQTLGMVTHRMKPEQHDRIVAYISHLPHLTASSICTVLSDAEKAAWKPFVGTGLLDSTRVASGSVSMWKDIVSHNRTEILEATTDLIHQLEHLKVHLENGSIEAVVDMLQQGKQYRDSIQPDPGK